jgi:uncharacterized membrane protein
MARGRDDTILLTAAALGAVAGLRSMAAPALLSHELSRGGHVGGGGGLEHLLTSETTSTLLTLLAGGEMLADKMPFIPDRTSGLPLTGRAVIGSLTAAVYAAHRRHPVFVAAVVGAAAAVASTYAGYHLRRIAAERFEVPDRILGMIEDALVVAATKGIAEAMER